MNSTKTGKPFSHLFKEFKDDGAKIKSTSKKRKAKKYGAVSSRKNSSFVRVIALYHGLFQLFAMFYGSGEGNFNHDLR